MKHMGNDERNRIEFMLGCGRNITEIAKALGRSQSTISREVLNRRIESEKHYACSNRICAHFDECHLKHVSSASDRGLRKNIGGGGLNYAPTSEKPYVNASTALRTCAMGAKKNITAQ